MKIVFLDIDGVLNHEYCKTLLHGIFFVENDKIVLLKELLDATDAKVVLSSTWRMGWHDLDKGELTQNAKDFIALKDKLVEFGVDLFDKTEDINYDSRGEEIEKWINDFESSGGKLDSFVILDDMNGKYLRPVSKFHVRTSVVNGLQPKHVKKAIQILNQTID